MSDGSVLEMKNMILFISLLSVIGGREVYAEPIVRCDIDAIFKEFRSVVRSGHELSNAFNFIDTTWLDLKLRENDVAPEKIKMQISSMQLFALRQTYLVEKIISYEKSCGPEMAKLKVNIKHAYDQYDQINVSFVNIHDKWFISSTSYSKK